MLGWLACRQNNVSFACLGQTLRHMAHPLNVIFITFLQYQTFIVNYQSVTALHNNRMFFEIMHARA